MSDDPHALAQAEAARLGWAGFTGLTVADPHEARRIVAERGRVVVTFQCPTHRNEHDSAPVAWIVQQGAAAVLLAFDAWVARDDWPGRWYGEPDRELVVAEDGALLARSIDHAAPRPDITGATVPAHVVAADRFTVYCPHDDGHPVTVTGAMIRGALADVRRRREAIHRAAIAG